MIKISNKQRQKSLTAKILRDINAHKKQKFVAMEKTIKRKPFSIEQKINNQISKVARWQEANPGLSWVNPNIETKEPKIYIPKEMLKSSVYRSLSRVAMLLLQDFLAKRIMKQAGKKKWFVENNGNIIFPVREAVLKGFSQSQFRDGIDELQKRGFLDITHLGKGGRKPLKGNADCSKYWLDDRWKKYGADDFKPARKPRRKDKRQGRGWALLMNDPKRKKEILKRRKNCRLRPPLTCVKINTS